MNGNFFQAFSMANDEQQKTISVSYYNVVACEIKHNVTTMLIRDQVAIYMNNEVERSCM